jgi:hypothetical protein
MTLGAKTVLPYLSVLNLLTGTPVPWDLRSTPWMLRTALPTWVGKATRVERSPEENGRIPLLCSVKLGRGRSTFPTIALLGRTETRVAVRGFSFLSFNFISYTARIDPCNAKAYHQ